MNRKESYSFGQLYTKNGGSTRKQIATMDVAVLCENGYFDKNLAKIGAIVIIK